MKFKCGHELSTELEERKSQMGLLIIQQVEDFQRKKLIKQLINAVESFIFEDNFFKKSLKFGETQY